MVPCAQATNSLIRFPGLSKWIVTRSTHTGRVPSCGVSFKEGRHVRPEQNKYRGSITVPKHLGRGVRWSKLSHWKERASRSARFCGKRTKRRRSLGKETSKLVKRHTTAQPFCLRLVQLSRRIFSSTPLSKIAEVIHYLSPAQSGCVCVCVVLPFAVPSFFGS